MLGLKKSPLKTSKHNSVDPARVSASRSNPFDSNDEFDNKQTLKPSRRTSSEHTLSPPNFGSNPFDDDGGRVNSSSSSYWQSSASRNNYKNNFRDSGGLENQSVQELENYAVYKAEETTKTVNSCLKIAEEMKEGATNSLITLHQQGEQITRTHNVAAGIDHDLSRGEKLLGSLGGMFSRTWKPKKTRPIVGPVITRDDLQKSSGHLEQREKLGLNAVPKGRSKSRTPPPESTDAFQKVEFQKAKQDDALSDLSDILGELKVMAVDMGSEIERQTKALDGVQDDVDVLNIRVQGANQRARRLLGK